MLDARNTMKCPDPACDGTMERGAAVIHTTTLGFLLFGLSWQKLFFRRPGGVPRDDIEVLNPDQRRVAFRCPKCAGIFVTATQQITHMRDPCGRNASKLSLNASTATTRLRRPCPYA